MNKVKVMFISIFVLILSVGTVHANEINGEIVDIFGANITTIKLDQNHNIKVGDKIDLTYMAGVLPMMIGVYEVTTVQGEVILSKPISSNMPAEKGMKVQIDLVQRQQETSKAKSDKNPSADASRVLLTVGEATQPDAQSAYMEIQGEVLEVMGQDIKVAIKGNGTPAVGWPVDLFYVTSKGKELPVGEWKVKSIDGQVLIAEKVKAMGNANKGLKAVVHNAKEKRTVQERESFNVDDVADVAAQKESFFEKKQVSRESMYESNKNAFLKAIETSPLMQEDAIIWEDEKSKTKPVEKVDASVYMYKNSSQSGKNSSAYQENSDKFSNALEKRNVVRKYWLGVEVTNSVDVSKQRYADFPMGVIVVDVMPNSAAERGGLKKGDMIYVVDKASVNDVNHFIELINRSDGTIKLKIQRGRKKIKKTIKLDLIK